MLGRLDQRWGGRSFYVHLRRDPEATARSLSKRWAAGAIMPAYADGILMPRVDPANATRDPLPIARDYVETVTRNVELFLRDKPHQMTLWLEELETCYPTFLDRIGADVDEEAALAELRTPRNVSRTGSVQEEPSSSETGC